VDDIRPTICPIVVIPSDNLETGVIPAKGGNRILFFCARDKINLDAHFRGHDVTYGLIAAQTRIPIT
jgi:hypothetical protein